MLCSYRSELHSGKKHFKLFPCRLTNRPDETLIQAFMMLLIQHPFDPSKSYPREISSFFGSYRCASWIFLFTPLCISIKEQNPGEGDHT